MYNLFCFLELICRHNTYIFSLTDHPQKPKCAHPSLEKKLAKSMLNHQKSPKLYMESFDNQIFIF